MTNKEKFMEVFNQEPDDTVCPIYCSMSDKKCPNFNKNHNNAWSCEAGDWWKVEYGNGTNNGT